MPLLPLLALRFLAELAGIAAMAYAGATVLADPWVQLLAAVGAPVAFVVTWAVVVAPKARNPLPQRDRQLVGTGLLVLAGVALVAAGQPGLGVAYAAIVLVDQALLLARCVPARAAVAGTGAATGRN